MIRIAGPLTLKTLYEFQERSREGAEDSVVLDLGGVPYADSAGLGAMLGVLASCQRQGKGFAVAAAGERIKGLFRLTRVEGLVNSFDTVGEAVQYLQKQAAASPGA